MPTWPGTLPTTLPLGTLEDAEDNTVSTQMDQGPRKIRKRFTAVTKTITPPPGRFIFTKAQRDTLLTFFDTTLQSGTLSFTWVSTGPTPEYDTDTTTKFRIIQRPQITSVVSGADSQRLYRVSMHLEVLP